MLQINPASTFPITRIITNHLETDTLYVRAVIKDAVNDTILETVDLDDKGSYYYRTNWKVVWDNVMARGRYITITTSVYTTNSYTTKSPNYGDELQIYVVQERWDSSKIIGGGYNGITTKDVEKVIKKEIDKLKFPKVKDVKFPKQTEYGANFKDITKGLTDIKVLVDGLPTQNNDLSPLIDKLDTLFKTLNNRPIFEKTDLKQIDKTLNNETLKIGKGIDNINKDLISVKKDTKELVGDKNITLNIQPIQTEIQSPQETNPRIKKLKAKFGIK